MISITNDTKKFMENNDAPLFVYGAGASGWWTGLYLKKCGFDFSCYLDKGIEREGALYGDKPVYQPKKLLEYAGHTVRVIITSIHYEAIMMDLMWSAKRHGLELLCLVPKYRNVTDGKDIYDINQMLAYFRQKLIVTEIPTILATDCNAGLLYAWLGWEIASPTINTDISHEDFLKLCQNPQYYFSLPMEEMEWSKQYLPPYMNPSGECYPQGKIGDIRVQFSHSQDMDKSRELWNLMRERINLKRVIAVITELNSPIPLSIMQRFSELRVEKLLLYRRHAPGLHYPGIVELPRTAFMDRSTVIEDTFDFVGWINGEHCICRQNQPNS